MFGEYQLSLHDYLSILRRRALVMILVFGAVLTASVVFAFLQPKIYESTATILVEGPQVQVQIAGGPGTTQPRPEDRVNLIQQRLMTRESLIRVADKHGLFPSIVGAAPSSTDVVNAMRQSIRLDLMGGSPDPWAPRSASISFNLSFQHEDPAKALAVTQELSVLRDRVDAIHALLDRKGVVTREDLENFVPDPAASAAERAAYLQRVFRVIRNEAGVVPSAEAEQHAATVEKQLSTTEG